MPHAAAGSVPIFLVELTAPHVAEGESNVPATRAFTHETFSLVRTNKSQVNTPIGRHS